ncbi:Levodione reductase [Lachnellula subtilissima]|uniref:Levodione reductase n=1 Tax=Lachnellula subtilissima TaxID=602034 RepID=A0A8H8RWW1_9HELO|nr:Levodione reductase [Lachnellula subtilissima]
MPMLNGIGLITGAGNNVPFNIVLINTYFGAGSGIGQATAVAFVQEGCKRLTIADMSASGLEKTTQVIKSHDEKAEVLELLVDVSNQDAVNEMVKKTVETFGRLDYAVNVAGVTCRDRSLAADYDIAEFDRVHSVNARGLLFCTQAEVQAMRSQDPRVTCERSDLRRGQRGSIVNIASTCGITAIPNIMPYVVSKHAVVGITRSFAVDHGNDRIRINAVCPGLVDTPMLVQRKEMERKFGNEGDKRGTVGEPPLGRNAYPEEIADTCTFLSSSKASYIHGSMIMADGGKTALY